MMGSAEAKLPVVAIVGAPNVGKSSFINRVIGKRSAVVAGEPGTTRDRGYNHAEWAGREFTLVDTGGIEPGSRGSEPSLSQLVTLQARQAASEADVIVHLTDSRLGVTEADAVVARELRKTPGRVILAVNKLDNPADDTPRYDFYSLGEGEPHAVSASHGLGFGDLLDVIVKALPEPKAPAQEDKLPRISIVGRPNVGKSTLLNRLLGSERAVVSEMAGTTTDAVAGELELPGGRYLLLDTAGVARSSRRAEGVPYYSYLRTEEAIRRSHVSLLLVDAVEGLVSGDLQIASKIAEAGRACGVLVNKRDLADPDSLDWVEQTLSARLTDLKPPFASVSALTGHSVDLIPELADKLYQTYNTTISTHELAEFVNRLVARTAPPKGVKIRYATQTGQSPPRFALFANRPEDLTDGYMRYIENSLRKRYDLYGCSIRLEVRSSRKS
ncbi:MAG: ribosome biogenesis GTPase Der [Rubrobacter sp.]|nr:ribosome biogenesis GTPase Der [Rubrobacter sp.]